MSKFFPSPQPIAVTRSDSSLFSSTLASEALSVFSTLPRSGRIAWRARSRPCFADPPAESPSTMKISLFSLLELVQSLNLPGRLSRVDVALLRDTSACAARLASRARAARANQTVDRRDELRVVQSVLRLPLELRLLNEYAEDAGQPFADILGGER